MLYRYKIHIPLYIIHNLIDFININQVKDYIKNILCLNFDLKKGHLNNSINKKEKEDTIYYYEENKSHQIYHLFLAKEESEAGNYYNDFTIKFLEDSFKSIINLKSFDVIKTVKERFSALYSEIALYNEKRFQLDYYDNSNNR